MAKTTKKTKVSKEEVKDLKEYDGPMAKYKVLKETPFTDENGEPAGVLEVGSIQDMPTILGDGLVADGFMELYIDGTGILASQGAEDIEIVPEPVEEAEMYNGKKIIARGEVEIHGVMKKTITTEEGSTYTL